MTDIAQRIEALLFVAGEPVPKKELVKVLGIDDSTLETALKEVVSALQGHGIALVRTEDEVVLVTSPVASQYLAQFLGEGNEGVSMAAAETLSIIAYRGPISRYDIDVLRGVDSRRIVRQLHRRGLIQRTRSAGRTPLYEITPEFLHHLGITRREDLPRFEVLSSHERVQTLLQKDE